MASNIHVALSQSSVSRSIVDVVNALNDPAIFNRWVKFPHNLETLQAKRNE